VIGLSVDVEWSVIWLAIGTIFAGTEVKSGIKEIGLV